MDSVWSHIFSRRDLKNELATNLRVACDNYFYGSCRGKGSELYIGLWALSEDVDWSEDEWTIARVLSSKSHKYHVSVKVREGGSRRSVSSDK